MKFNTGENSPEITNMWKSHKQRYINIFQLFSLNPTYKTLTFSNCLFHGKSVTIFFYQFPGPFSQPLVVYIFLYFYRFQTIFRSFWDSSTFLPFLLASTPERKGAFPNSPSVRYHLTFSRSVVITSKHPNSAFANIPDVFWCRGLWIRIPRTFLRPAEPFFVFESSEMFVPNMFIICVIIQCRPLSE